MELNHVFLLFKKKKLLVAAFDPQFGFFSQYFIPFFLCMQHSGVALVLQLQFFLFFSSSLFFWTLAKQNSDRRDFTDKAIVNRTDNSIFPFILSASNKFISSGCLHYTLWVDCIICSWFSGK